MPPDVTPLHLFDHPDIEAFWTWSGFLVTHTLAPWGAVGRRVARQLAGSHAYRRNGSRRVSEFGRLPPGRRTAQGGRMSAVRVWLGRHIHVPDAGTGYFVRAVELPIAPFPGLGVTLKRGMDPTDIKFVYVNWAGAVVAEVEEAVYDDDTFDDHDQKVSQFAWETDGWVKTPSLGPGAAYSLPPPTDADLAAWREKTGVP